MQEGRQPVFLMRMILHRSLLQPRWELSRSNIYCSLEPFEVYLNLFVHCTALLQIVSLGAKYAKIIQNNIHSIVLLASQMGVTKGRMTEFKLCVRPESPKQKSLRWALYQDLHSKILYLAKEFWRREAAKLDILHYLFYGFGVSWRWHSVRRRLDGF